MILAEIIKGAALMLMALTQKNSLNQQWSKSEPGDLLVYASEPDCNLDWKPVCGTDKVTYGNMCLFKMAQEKNASLQVAHEGVCDSPKKTVMRPQEIAGFAQGTPCPCPLNPQTGMVDYKPVCGTDGVTYGHICLLDCAREHKPNLGVTKCGECGSPRSAFSSSPSSEEVQPRRLSVSGSGSCGCTLDYMPVCGTDKVTYGNICALDCAKKNDSSLMANDCGECGSGAPLHRTRGKTSGHKNGTPCPCPLNPQTGMVDYKPVCGTNGVTYGHICLLDCAREQKPSLGVRKCGECGSPKDASASSSEEVQPRRLSVSGSGSCGCTLDYMPICGTDKVTYGNICTLDCAKKNNPSLMANDCGECGSGTIQPLAQKGKYKRFHNQRY